MVNLSLTKRIESRDYPSIYQAWGAVENGPGITNDTIANLVKHDLVWQDHNKYGLAWDGEYDGLSTSFTKESIEVAREYVKKLEEKNPNIVILLELRYFVSWIGYLPEDSPYWMRNNDGTILHIYDMPVKDFRNEEFRKIIGKQAEAVAQLDFIDGILVDCFNNDPIGNADEDHDRVDVIKKIRKGLGEDKLIIVNSNRETRPNVAPYINGLFMECAETAEVYQWENISSTLRWAEQNLRKPTVNCIEFWTDNKQIRDDVNKMRAVTTLSLTHSNGYVLFCEEGSHAHDWYSFWDIPLGYPIVASVQNSNNTWSREFTNGIVVYNPMGNGSQTITFSNNKKSMATGIISNTFILNDKDGDIYFTYTSEKQP